MRALNCCRSCSGALLWPGIQLEACSVSRDKPSRSSGGQIPRVRNDAGTGRRQVERGAPRRKHALADGPSSSSVGSRCSRRRSPRRRRRSTPSASRRPKSSRTSIIRPKPSWAHRSRCRRPMARPARKDERSARSPSASASLAIRCERLRPRARLIMRSCSWRRSGSRSSWCVGISARSHTDPSVLLRIARAVRGSRSDRPERRRVEEPHVDIILACPARKLVCAFASLQANFDTPQVWPIVRWPTERRI